MKRRTFLMLARPSVSAYSAGRFPPRSIPRGSAAARGTKALAGSLEFMFGAGSEMQLAANGAPEQAVASIMKAPAQIALGVLTNSPIRTPKDLSGRTVGVTSIIAHCLVHARDFAPRGWGTGRHPARALGGGRSRRRRTHRGDHRRAYQPDRSTGRPGGGGAGPRSHGIFGHRPGFPRFRNLRRKTTHGRQT